MRRTVPIWREAQRARDEANGMKQHKNNERTMKTVITILKYVNELNFFNNVQKTIKTILNESFTDIIPFNFPVRHDKDYS